MCILKINTTVPASDIDEKFLELSAESFAKTFQKPKSVSKLSFINLKICRIINKCILS